MNSGWCDNGYRLSNFINENWIGVKINKCNDGQITFIGLLINDYVFGWCESYNMDGSIDNYITGNYIKDMKT